jgi:hypothetical protein
VATLIVVFGAGHARSGGHPFEGQMCQPTHRRIVEVKGLFVIQSALMYAWSAPLWSSERIR